MFEIRKTRTVTQGRRRLTRVREEYFRLVQQGVSYAEAAKAIGINLRTGKRWPNDRNPSGRMKAAPPTRPMVPPSGASRYLCEADRIYIADRLLEKATVRTIAAEPGRNPSTVSREIRRNRHPVNGQYRPFAAQARADDRRPRPKNSGSAIGTLVERSTRYGLVPQPRQPLAARLDREHERAAAAVLPQGH